MIPISHLQLQLYHPVHMEYMCHYTEGQPEYYPLISFIHKSKCIISPSSSGKKCLSCTATNLCSDLGLQICKEVKDLRLCGSHIKVKLSVYTCRCRLGTPDFNHGLQLAQECAAALIANPNHTRPLNKNECTWMSICRCRRNLKERKRIAHGRFGCALTIASLLSLA